MTLTRVNSNGITEIDKTKISGTAITAADTGTVTSAMIADGQITSAKIADATIVNQDVSLTAAIEGTKISPNFGSQNVVTTGQLSAAGINYPTSGSLSGRNRIINGDMRIDQRNAGAAVTGGNGGYSVDRWTSAFAASGKFNYGQSTTAPVGFTHSLLHTVAVAHTAAAGDYMLTQHFIEGFNVADLGFGTAAAQSVTISFWVRSSVTGTYSVAIGNSADNRAYVTTFAINSANTFEYKTVTIPGDTTGTWLTNNGKGISLKFDLGSGSSFVAASTNAWVATNTFKASGSVSLVANAGATFYITGVQLEAGTVATPFERRSYGQELALCQRYYQRQGDSTYAPLGAAMIAQLTGSETAKMTYQLICPMRSAPTVSASGTNAFTLQSGTLSVTDATFTGSWSAAQATNGVWLDFGSATNPGWVTRNAAMIYRVTGGGFLQFSAEL